LPDALLSLGQLTTDQSGEPLGEEAFNRFEDEVVGVGFHSADEEWSRERAASAQSMPCPRNGPLQRAEAYLVAHIDWLFGALHRAIRERLLAAWLIAAA